MPILKTIKAAKKLKGIYVLLIQINKRISIEIGALGEVTFPEGLFAYVGSAQNNLELRVKRHQRKEKRLFWHIDYLLNNPAAKITDVLYKVGGKPEECKIANLLQQKAEPITGFGNSDCKCNSHLFRSRNFGFLKQQMKDLKLNNNL